ncbi:MULTISPECIES: ABC transporter ATP-binding protein [unclassified Maridesulfovibrio]|uniref:ABC transporter ATP-binding protein n=1 Tax=unclassified Maridesulfovibrio TaxID=2794999 RepID=UPI003B40603E
MAEVVIENIVKSYGETVALDHVSLNIDDGELVSVLGASGCGKTTLLRVMAGFEEIDSGLVRAGEHVFSSGTTHVSPENRNVGVVFQSYALWPHMNVAENIGYPLKIKGSNGQALKLAVRDALESVGLSGMGDRNPADLSGGQRQRVALARCLIMAPDVVLLDEPLANLDVHLRESMLMEFKAFHEKTKATMLFVTHDQSEAMAIADRIAVMDHGHIVQFSTPQELYDCPATVGVARFVGNGSILPVEVQKAGAGECELCIDDYCFTARHSGAVAGQKGSCALKCGWVRPGDKGLSCTAKRSIYTGGQTNVELQVDCLGELSEPVNLCLPGFAHMEPGKQIKVEITDGWFIG